MPKPISASFYGNDAVYNQEGVLIFKCARKKSEWYLKRGLAEIITENPFSIRLLFQANGAGHAGDAFFLEGKKNECCVCGTAENLTRHHILPYEYRRWFPAIEKSHDGHDVIMVCESHHQAYEKEAVRLKRSIAERYGVNYRAIQRADKEEVLRIAAVKSAWALYAFDPLIPAKKKGALQERVQRVFPDHSIEEVAQMSVKSNKTPLETHGQEIVSQLESRQTFVEEWRQHFIDVMRPAFMSPHWSIKRPLRTQES